MTEQDKQLLSEFSAWMHARGHRPRGIEEMARRARQYLAYAADHGLAIAALTIRDAEAYREHLRLLCAPNGRPRYSPKTINLALTSLRLLYRYLMGVNQAYRNPFLGVESMKEPWQLPRAILSIEETGRLLAGIKVESHADVRFKVLLELLYSTGARIAELEELRPRDIMVDEGYIVIRGDKERQDRRCPLTDMSRELLRLYLAGGQFAPDAAVFRHRRKRGINEWMNTRLGVLTKELGLPYITCHSLRHTVGTQLLKAGADIREVQEYLGHRRIGSTDVYTHLVPDDLKDVLAKSHPREMSTDEVNDADVSDDPASV